MQPQRGEHVHRRLLTEALHSSSTLQGSRQADGAHLSEVLNADSRNAFLNRLPVLMKLANAWPDLPRTAKNCQMHESFFCSSYPSLKKTKNSQLTSCTPVSFKQAPPSRHAIPMIHSSSLLFSSCLPCWSHACSWDLKRGVFGVIFLCNSNTKGRAGWLERVGVDTIVRSLV